MVSNMGRLHSYRIISVDAAANAALSRRNNVSLGTIAEDADHATAWWSTTIGYPLWIEVGMKPWELKGRICGGV